MRRLGSRVQVLTEGFLAAEQLSAGLHSVLTGRARSVFTCEYGDNVLAPPSVTAPW